MIFIMLPLLFLGSCAYDDEHAALLQAQIKNQAASHKHNETQPADVEDPANKYYPGYNFHDFSQSLCSKYGEHFPQTNKATVLKCATKVIPSNVDTFNKDLTAFGGCAPGSPYSWSWKARVTTGHTNGVGRNDYFAAGDGPATAAATEKCRLAAEKDKRCAGANVYDVQSHFCDCYGGVVAIKPNDAGYYRWPSAHLICGLKSLPAIQNPMQLEAGDGAGEAVYSIKETNSLQGCSKGWYSLNKGGISYDSGSPPFGPQGVQLPSFHMKTPRPSECAAKVAATKANESGTYWQDFDKCKDAVGVRMLAAGSSSVGKPQRECSCLMISDLSEYSSTGPAEHGGTAGGLGSWVCLLDDGDTTKGESFLPTPDKSGIYNPDGPPAPAPPSQATTTTTTPTTKDPQCKGGCFNAKGVLNPAKSCGKSNCDGCCECTGECPPTEPPVKLQCDDSCYTKKGILNPSKQCSKDKCNNCCECTGECQDWDDLEDDEKGNEIDDEHRPEYECAKWCYSKKHKAKSWEKKCTWFACSTCPECPDEEKLMCKGSCYTAKGVLNPSKQCGKEICEGCCECTSECPPTEPPMELKCDDSCYTKKGNLNPSKQCSKDKCNGCCECTGQCQDWDDLEDDEKGNEIDDEHLPEYECAKWCYSKKHKAKSWEKKCTWFACSTCPECPEEEDKCSDKCYKKSGKVRKDKCSTSECEGCAECHLEGPECDARCYNEKNGEMKLSRCDQRKCAACPECDEEQNPREPECDEDACWNAKNGKFKTHKCGDMQCAACSECDQEDASKPLKCDGSCFKQGDGSLKPNICTKNKCAGCSGCS